MDIDAYLNDVMQGLIEDIEGWVRQEDDPENPVTEVPLSSVMFERARSRLEGILEGLARAGAIEQGEVSTRKAGFDQVLEDRGLIKRRTISTHMGTEQVVTARATEGGGPTPPSRTMPDPGSSQSEPTVLLGVVPLATQFGLEQATVLTGLSLEVWSDRMRFNYIQQMPGDLAPVSSREHMDAMSDLTRHRGWEWEAWDDTGATYRTIGGHGGLVGGTRMSPPLWAASVVLTPGPDVDARQLTIRQRTREAVPMSISIELPRR